MFNLLKKFFAAVADTKKGILIPEELLRSILTSLGSGSMIGLALTVFQSLLTNAGVIFPNPLVGGVVTVVLTLVIDLIRRLNQGPTPPTPGKPAA